MASLQKRIRAGRKDLGYVAKDLRKILELGERTQNVDSDSLLDDTNKFRASVGETATLKQEYLNTFKEISHLAASEDDSEVDLFPTDADLSNREEFNDMYLTIVQYQQLLSKVDKVVEHNDNNNSGNSSFLNNSLARTRLPKISLPHFNGNIETWPKFKLLFESMVHSNPEIPLIEKFHYLHTSLSGESFSLIASLTLNEENYDEAWNAICRRYDNKRLLANTYIDKFLDFAPLKGNQNLPALQSFVSNVGETVAGFKSIGIDDESDFIWLSFALRKLDATTREQFEAHSIGTKQQPTFGRLIEFVQERCQVLQFSCSSPSSSLSSSKVTKPTNHSKVFTTMTSPSKQSVSLKPNICNCKPSHPLFFCPTFKAKTPSERRDFARRKSLCFNCLTSGHMVNECNSRFSCKHCQGKHNTLLHDKEVRNHNRARSWSPPKNQVRPKQSSSRPPTPTIIASVTGSNAVILGTAKALVRDCQGKLQPVRLLLDCGSQCSLITTKCIKRLGLSWIPSNIRPIGAGEILLPKIKGKSQCQLFSSQDPRRLYELSPLVVNNITGMLPSSPLPCSNFKNYGTLADPDFNKPAKIDILIGGDLFMKVTTGAPRSIDKNYDALPTVFGLVIMGVLNHPNMSEDTPHCHLITKPNSTDQLLARFWETEEVAPPSDSYENDPCEQHFKATHARDSSGRYVLALPFKDLPLGLEGSKNRALVQYKSLERKMGQNLDLKNKYNEFLQEYQALGHMSETKRPSCYVIPHHGVFKANEANSKIRVVFNASCPTSNGSLNDKLLVGPKLQNDLTSVILNFRLYKVAVTADLVKMYRQILIREEDRQFQHILWRPSETSDIKVYELNTVTYGQACAPFQAIRTIHQLVKDEGKPYPLASNALMKECYVDDVVSGGKTLAEAQQLQKELGALLKKGGFQIHKWASNCSEFTKGLDQSGSPSSPLGFDPKEHNVTKILGMFWDSHSDTFYYQVGDVNQPVTKRGILSVIARLFDPMGYLAPVVFQAKTILQELWKAQIDWDQSPPSTICQDWEEFSRSIQALNEIKIPRFILSDNTCHTQLIGFCDASQCGFAAVMYLRIITSSGEVKVSLLKAKTKLAPLKTLSIPRLELSAAHLLTKLYLSVAGFCETAQVSEQIFLSDSTIVLAWIKIAPYMLDTFVANRVSYIISNTNISQWCHVMSESNPADLGSRGCFPPQIVSNALWWAGPDFLYDKNWVPPKPPVFSGEVPELRAKHLLLLESQESHFYDWIGTRSRYLTVLRTHGYVLRALKNFQYPRNRVTGELTNEEMQSSLHSLIKIVQRQTFASDYSWTDERPLTTKLKTLAVYLDSEGILRVGGRLHHSDLPVETQSPILLPGNCHFTRLLIRHQHVSHLHLGYQGLHALLNRTFWIFGLRQAIKSQLHRCLPCLKLRARPQNPFMGDLPASRVRPSRPFSHCGIDYAGPFTIKHSAKRNSAKSKAYLCLFICMATRAVHLEVVSALSTEAFLATFDRFIARRGCPSNVISDNGTNFVGAYNQLKELFALINSQPHQDRLTKYSSIKGFSWHFNPPHSPHFGGLWEAAVKSAKHHLYKITNCQAFYFEELTTLFARIEAVMNSRPLCTSSNDASSDNVLTPGHFLIGAPLISAPEENITDLKVNYLSRWQLINQCVQHFWNRWHVEYLQSLQRRIKWFNPANKPIKPDDLVLVPDSSSLPLQWRVGRVAECFPGKDDIVRVISVKDHRGVFKHPIHKIVNISQINDSQDI